VLRWTTSNLTDRRLRVKPINYNIELSDLELGGAFGYQGLVNIEVDIKSAVASLTLNAHQLKIHSAVIEGKDVNGRSIRELILLSSFLSLARKRYFV